jgi:hypothetical protein
MSSHSPFIDTSVTPVCGIMLLPQITQTVCFLLSGVLAVGKKVALSPSESAEIEWILTIWALLQSSHQNCFFHNTVMLEILS